MTKEPPNRGSTMLRTSILPPLAVVAIIGEALFFGHVSRERPEVIAVTAVRAVPSRASELQEQVLSALAPARVGETVGAAARAFPRRSADTGDAFTPVFDIVRVEPTGDAVIAGRAAPAATVELLRNGEFHDRAIADQSGQFVMVPPRLPPGEYELTLRSRQPDGNQATSKQSAVVALQPPLKDQTVVAPTVDVVLSKTVAHKGGPVGAVSR
jgi:hypothetical protein